MKESTKQKTLLWVIALSIIPFLVSVRLPSPWTGKSAALYGSGVTGFVGVLFLLWEYILGTRSVTGKILKDLAWTLRVHKALGIYGTLLIFLHPLLIIYNYGENLLYTIVPNFSSSFEKSASWGRLAFFILLLTWVTSAVVRGKIAYRPWKYIHYLSYIALPAVVLHAPRLGSTLGRSGFALAYWYTVVSLFIIFACIRLRYLFGFGKGTFQVLSNKLIGEDIWMMRLKTITKLQISPGQYIYVQPTLKNEEHPFSVIDFYNENGELAFAYKKVGAFTDKLTRIAEGSTIMADGPYGSFTSEFDTAKPTVFIAGGIGITPFLKHLRDSTAKNIILFNCNRTRTSGIFRNFLKNTLGSRHIDVLSNDKLSNEPNVESGYISAAIVNKYLSDPKTYTYFLCGPKELMKTTRVELSSLGIQNSQIYSEEFGF